MISRHLQLEVAAVFWRGEPLPPGAPVPGCDCEHCTGIAADAPARRRPRPRKHRQRDELDVEAARAVPIATAAQAVGIHANRRGYACCPFHEDRHPSLHLNAKKNAAFCNPCGRSWDSIALTMEMLNVPFADAVRQLTGAIIPPDPRSMHARRRYLRSVERFRLR